MDNLVKSRQRIILSFFLSFFFIVLAYDFYHSTVVVSKEPLVRNSNAIIKEGSPGDRQREIIRLLDYDAAHFLKEFYKGIEHSNRDVRYAGVWALTRVLSNDQFQRPKILKIKSSQYSTIIDHLLARLRKEADPWVKSGIISALHNIEAKKQGERLPLDKSVLEAVLPLVKDSDPYIRAQAVGVISVWDNPIAKEAQRTAFYDDVWLVRAQSVWFHSRNHGNEGYEILARALKDENPNMRAVTLLVGLEQYQQAPWTVELLLEALQDPSSSIVNIAIEKLSERKEDKAIGPLLELLEMGGQSDNSLRRGIEKIAGKSLEEVKKEYGTEFKENRERKAQIRLPDVRKQIEVLEKGNTTEKVSAVLRLTWVDAPAATEALIKALQNQEPRVRYAAMDAIAASKSIFKPEKKPQKVLDILMIEAKDPNPFLRIMAINNLWSLNHENKNYIVEFLSEIAFEERDPLVKIAAVSGLRGLTEKVEETDKRRISEILVHFLNDEFFEIRKDALLGINPIVFPEAIDLVIKKLKDKDSLIREQAARQLGGVQDKKVLTPLIQALNDPSEDVRVQVVRSLGKLEQPEVIQHLKRMQKNDSSEKVRDAARTELFLLLRTNTEKVGDDEGK